jgi:hypothetical protein
MRGVCLLLAASARLFADGGMIVLHQQAPPYVVTVFASPAPPRAGIVDLSVLLQKGETQEPVLDAEVQIEITREANPIRVSATHKLAQNKFLYAASLPLDEPGIWSYTVSLLSAASPKPIVVPGQIAVSGKTPKLVGYAGYLALPFVFLAVFALHQWLCNRRPLSLTAAARE